MEPELSVADTHEIELIQQAQGGDLRSFSLLVEIYQERAVHIAYSWVGNFEDARDLAQDAFVKAYENLASFKAESRFYTWFYRVLSNVCKDFLRKKNVRKHLSVWLDGRNDEDEAQEPEETAVSTAKDSSEVLANKELSIQIDTALEKLPAQQKAAFIMRYLEGLSLNEIAEVMQLSEGAVKAHLWQAAQKMRKTLGSSIAA